LFGTIVFAVAASCTSDPAVYDDDTGAETGDTSGDGDGDGDGDTSDDGPGPNCGDGVHDAGEECDDGEGNRPDAACTPECTKNVCGDGFTLADVEECDDANLDDADGCEADCSLPACGNGIIDPGEVCYDEPVVHDLGIYYAVLEVADLDHDGSSDLVLLDNAEDDIGVLLGTGDGNFVAKDSVEAPEESNGIALADLDGDEDLDVIVASGRGFCFMLPCDTVPATITWRLGDGAGGFGDPTTVEIGDTNWVVITGDLDGDDRVDVITGDQTGKALYVSMGQDSAPWLGDPTTIAVDGQVHGVAVGDLDGDDQPDVVTVGGSNVQILLGNGDGSFDAQATMELGKGLVDPWLADVDDDGDLDILTPGKSGTVVHVLSNDGDAGFGHADEAWAGWAPNHMVVADLSQDGIVDYALANTQPNLITVGVGLGDGTFDEVPAFEPWGGPLDLVAADFDEDGTMDLAITRPGKDAVSVLLADP
jgi:cysteine-rich repeat protein